MTKETKGNSRLNNAKINPDDEFYTPYQVAKDLINPFIEQLKGKKIICPCDSPKSYIYIYLEELGMDVDYSTEMHSVNYNNYDIVITNPPFSKMQEFMRCIYGKKFLIIAFWMLPSIKWFIERVQQFKFYYVGHIKYINNDKVVNTIFVSNLVEPQEWKDKMNGEIISGKIYSSDAWTKSNRVDFSKITLIENGEESFFKLVYGKTNEWMLKNIPNLNLIRFNNYEKNFNSINAKDYVDDDEQMTIFDLMEGGE